MNKYLQTHQLQCRRLELGMGSVLTAVAIVVVSMLALLAAQYLSAPSQLARTQNYADLSAISAAQLIQNGAEADTICPRISQLLRADAKTKLRVEECEIDGEIARVKIEYVQALPFLSRPISAQSRAGPAHE